MGGWPRFISFLVPTRRDILDRVRVTGPLTSRDLPDTCVKLWVSTGWNGDKNVTMLLGFTVQRGEITVAGRKAMTTAIDREIADLARWLDLPITRVDRE